MHCKSLLAVAVCVSGLSGAPAFAGEITGPPGTPGDPGSATGKQTGAVLNANSACAFNGLNDMNQGQVDLIVQNYGANKRLGLDLGFPGTGCNPTRAS
jgi:hypothetical protein